MEGMQCWNVVGQRRNMLKLSPLEKEPALGLSGD